MVTFSPDCFDQYPTSVRFLTYGTPLLDELLQSIPAPAPADMGSLARLESDNDVNVCGWYAPQKDFAVEIRTLPELQDALKKLLPAQDISAQANALFARQAQEIQERQAAVLAHRRKAQYMTELVKARQVLLKAATVEITLGLQPELFDTDQYPISFKEHAVKGLQRHRAPWAALLSLAFEPGLSPSESDLYYQQNARDNRESLKGRFNQLTHEARKAVQALSRLR